MIDPGDVRGSQEARDGAERQVEANAAQEVKDAVQSAIECIAFEQEELQCCDVWLWMGRNCPKVRPHEPRMLGPEMNKAGGRGIIENTHRTGYSKRKKRHRGIVTIWRSLVFQQVGWAPDRSFEASKQKEFFGELLS